MATITIVGNGEKILFWTDRWLDGHTLDEIAPNLFNTVPKRLTKRRTVAQALQNNRWVGDIKGARTVQVMYEYLQIWDIVENIVLQQDTPDQYKWKLSQSGSYNSKSAYAAFFEGSVRIGP